MNHSNPVQGKGVLIDVTRCTGCGSCAAACRDAQGAGAERLSEKLRGDGLSGRRLSSVVSVGRGRHAKKQCLHCLTPGCVDACLVGALTRTPEGAVVYDADKCIGCRYCMLSCPVSIPRYEWDKRAPLMKKCDLCSGRLRQGLAPVCVGACPEKALSFGSREQLLMMARQRIAAQPGVYLSHIYGEKELGGTSVLYISDVPLEALGWPAIVGEQTMQSYTWPVMSKTPALGLGACGLLVGVNFIIRRRMKLQSLRAAAAAAPHPGADVGESEGDAR